MNFLETIIGRKKAIVDKTKTEVSLEELMRLVSGVKPKNDFRKSLSRPAGEPVKVIAEIKRASPSKGTIAADIDPAGISRDYEAGGASAISILTEDSYFKGSAEDLITVRKAVPDIPLLRKDFIVDEYQIYESVHIGADAILLIVAALSVDKLKNFVAIAKKCGLSALVEVHDDRELDAALSSGAEIIGVNNRNLVNFEVSPETSVRIAARIPAGIVSVSESGISDIGGLHAAGELGYSAVLVGEHFMRAADRAAEVRKFAHPEPLK